MPKNKLGRAIFTNLHVYAGPDHKHEAQPKEITQKYGYNSTIGRRKSVARIYLSKGKGNITINNRDKEYPSTNPALQIKPTFQPCSKMAGKFDMKVN